MAWVNPFMLDMQVSPDNTIQDNNNDKIEESNNEK